MIKFLQLFRPGSLLWITIVFFFLGAAPGFWVPAVSNLLENSGASWLIPWAFIPSSVAALLSPLAFGALADHRVRAEHLLAGISLAGAVFLWLAFRSLIWGWDPWWFAVFMMCNALISAPMWSLLSTIAMTPMSQPEKYFPLVRIGGTVGWIVAGFAVGNWLRLDGSPYVGDWVAGVRVILFFLCFMLPFTPPKARSDGSRCWKDRLGLGALVLMKERDQRVYFLTTAFLSIPLAAFYMYTPRHLAVLGDQGPTATMAWGQITEIIAMLGIGAILGRFRIKRVLLFALLLAIVRYGLFAMADGSEHGRSLMVIGIGLHGVLYTFFFITGQIFMERRVDKGMRAQAQALLSVMANGIGGLIGYVTVYLWHKATAQQGDWQSFWLLLSGLVLITTVYFMSRYQGKKV